MKNNRKTGKLVAILLLVTMIALVLLSGTYAKYTSSASGSDIATVAKWSFEANGKEIAVTGSTPTVTFDLFNTINDTDESDKKADGSNVEADVQTGLIAPGTQGSFDIQLQNKSEVTAQYEINYEVTKSNDTLPIKFSVDGGTTWLSDLKDTTAADNKTLAKNSAVTSITVQWKWDFSGDDAVDTALGVAAQQTTTLPKVTVTATITATQVD